MPTPGRGAPELLQTDTRTCPLVLLLTGLTLYGYLTPYDLQCTITYLGRELITMHLSTRPVAPGIIEARGLAKSYGDVVALDNLDLTVPEGTVLALLGPNGAGKTTAVSILTTLTEPDSGTPACDRVPGLRPEG